MSESKEIQPAPDEAALRKAVKVLREALVCTNRNLYRGMSRSIQRLQAKENVEALAATEGLVK